MNSSDRRIAVLGAGYMGSAITFPITDNNIEVNLWGTWLDDEIIYLCKNNKPHPKLDRHLNPQVKLFYSDDLDNALKNIDAIIIAVSSEGFTSVYDILLDKMDVEKPIIAVTKGFVEKDDTVYRISEYADLMYKKRFGENIKWASIGGPVKAVELSRRVPTATIIGTASKIIRRLFNIFSTKYYRISFTDDIIGLELSSALKNVYAIAMGICDGYYSNREDDLYHNFKSLIFMESIEEMAFLSKYFGALKSTPYGLAGTGDLYVTASSGRNSLYGKRIGMGQRADTAYEDMLKGDKLVEGYNTLRLGFKYIESRGVDVEKDLPLYDILYKIIFEDGRYNGQLDELPERIKIS